MNRRILLQYQSNPLKLQSEIIVCLYKNRFDAVEIIFDKIFLGLN